MIIEKRKNRPSWKFIISIFGCTLASGILIFSMLYILLEPEPPQPLYLQGNPEGVRELSQPRDLIDFTLPASTGENVSLSDFRGSSVLLFFGYTYCPDICPLTLSHVRQAHDLLGDRADNVQFIYITVDPTRDTAERLAEYFVPFRVADFTIGLVGDDTTLQRISADYSLYYRLNNEDDSMTYSVDHTASVYFINTEGQLDTIFSYGTRPELIVEHILEKMS